MSDPLEQKPTDPGSPLSEVAHELNNILGSIIGNAELALMKLPEGSEVQSYLEKIIKAGERAANLLSATDSF